MFSQQWQRLILILPLIFFLGWSGIAPAMMNHITLSDHSNIDSQHLKQNSSLQHHQTYAIENCHDKKAQNYPIEAPQFSESIVHASSHVYVDDDLYAQCSDCVMMHCVGFISFIINDFNLRVQPFCYLQQQSSTDYRAEWSAGYWQDLLRPPQSLI